MRLLLVADLHYTLPQFDWVVARAGEFDLVVMAGDHLDIGSVVDGLTQSVVVKKYFTRLRAKTRLVVCSGNHDLDAKADGEKIARWLGKPLNDGVLSDGESFAIGDTLITSCPWWDGPVTRAQVAEQLEDAAQKRGRRWIWIYHAPPDRSPISWGGERYFGDVELSRWIASFAPDIVLSGHVHQSPFIADGSWVDRIGETWVFNAGHEIGPIPPHVILDTDADEAVWFSSTGVQSVRLGAPLIRPVPKLSALPDWLRPPEPPQTSGQA